MTTTTTTKQHVYAQFISHNSLYDYHRLSAKNACVASDFFVQVGGEGEEEDEEEVERQERQEAPAAAAAAASSSSSPSASLSTLLFERRASALIPLDAPRPLQIALGTSFIKIRMRQSVKVFRRRRSKSRQEEDPAEEAATSPSLPSPSSAAASSSASIEAVEFLSASALWIPEGSRDLVIGNIRVSASYHLRGDEREGEKNVADDAANASAGQPVVRFDVSTTADFRPEGFLAAFKAPLDSIMLSSLLKTAREMSSWFAACSASDAGVGPASSSPPSQEQIAAAVVDVGPRLPRELAYLRLRRLSVDGTPGVSCGMSVEESDELLRVSSEASERALARVLGAEWKKKGRESLAASAAEQKQKPATPESRTTKKSVAAALGERSALPASSSRSSSFSSVESFLSAASELPESGCSFGDDDDDGPFSDDDNKPSSQAAVSGVAAPPTPVAAEKNTRTNGNSSRSVSDNSSPKRALRVPRWLTPQAKEAAAVTAAGGAGASPFSSPSSRRSSRPGSAHSLPEKPTPALPLFKKWLRPKSART